MLMLEPNELTIGFEFSLPMQVLQLFLQVVDSFVLRQYGYSIADVLAKAVFGLLIYKIARLKSFADDRSFAKSEGH